MPWTPITATLRAADGRVLYRTELDRATVRCMGDLPDGPVRWLAGFAGAEAAPGESVTVRVPLPARTFQVWTPDGWRTRAGRYRIEAAHSVADVRLTATVEL